MKAFDLYRSAAPFSNQELLGKFISPQKTGGPNFYFVRDGDHLLAYRERIHVYPPGSTRHEQKELIANKLELPLSGVRWFINVIKQKFFKSPEAGGLAADSISYRELVDGETLHVIRVMMAGCPQPGCYDLTNLNRVSHIDGLSKQFISLSYPWLFQDGLMDFLKEIANNYEQGKL